jgi:hypothetical protein
MLSGLLLRRLEQALWRHPVGEVALPPMPVMEHRCWCTPTVGVAAPS